MGFFSKPKKTDGWLAFALHGDGISAAHVKRAAGGKPQVRLAQFFSTDKRPLAEVLEKIGKELHANSFNCSTLLGGREYNLMAVEAPAVDASEMRTAVRWRLKDMLDFPVDKATIDILDIPVDKAMQARGSTIFAVAANNKTIEERQHLFGDAAIHMRVIDIPEMAQRNISALLEPDGRGLAMLSFNADGGLLTVTYKGELYLSRRIDVAMELLADPDHERRHAQFDKITLELQRSLDHFDRQFNFINVSKLVLTPSGAVGLDEYLSSNLYTPVETMDLATVLDFTQVPELADVATQQRFFMTLGAALRQGGASA